ncbi:hypothetical protein L486_03382 [Kwoniella mangroviensis CBS 10435]|uniref:Uncharacterized protein n=1 Tax=Kwoniella mangroviensis CBS 10435 TaxID=1331196 RepID=A0A1B9ITR3_9TREE|nr:uncharacterized protein I203_02067 [Kwoniella mangroviensis CBS 8507]OCF58890.1 hypothetical protein L486_03382 [Kwoniella mangroviensis CBS 10435]OCF68682.1 hypothetical protein I203_02067 [Kwoniella mangroviensis CBS 8507]OCF76855.1 hypothetical protein I204_02562 [Kwoniella mangroviensis CBS 8886]
MSVVQAPLSPGEGGPSAFFSASPMSASMSNSTSKGSSLFAEDYSLSSPSHSTGSNSPNHTPGPTPRASTIGNDLSTSINIAFPPKPFMGLPASVSPGNHTLLPTPPTSPRRADNFTAPPPPIIRNKPSFTAMDPLDEELSPKPTPSSSVTTRGAKGYHTYEACMEGALGHDTKSSTYKVGTEKAYHHLNRASELFQLAIELRPQDKKAMLGRSKVLLNLATNYQPPRVATQSLRDAVSTLRELVKLAPLSLTARETLGQACGLLASTLHELDDNVEDEKHIWESEIGQLARESLQFLEDVAGDKMDRMRDLGPNEAAQQSPAMAEMFLSLSSAAVFVSSLAIDLNLVDLHIELAEQALDQASNMATVAAAARIKSSTSSANLITRVQLASGASSLERLRHTFHLGVDLDEDDFRALIQDMSMLATECRERAAKLKGSKASAAATLAWEAIRQLGDAKTLYANLLRLVWRKRGPRRRSTSKNTPIGTPRRMSTRNGSLDAPTIQEEDEEEQTGGTPRKDSDPKSVGRRESTSSTGSRGQGSRKGSILGAVSEDAEVSNFHSARGRLSRPSISIPQTGRRGSWLPSPAESGGATGGRTRRRSSLGFGSGPSVLPPPSPEVRSRRISSIGGGGPLVGPDGISAWNRKASVISLGSEDEAQGLVPSSELARSAWQLLEGAVKQYKLALSVLNGSDLPNAQLAKAKNETLTAIAYCSLFMASLAPRLQVAAEKRTSLLVTAEVYSTWAAREVGWSFLIEGTQAAQLADRRTNSWRADEAGKRAVMLLVRAWWHRAVTTESIDVNTKTSAKDAVETVIRRMKDKEGATAGDVARMRYWLAKQEGDMDGAESLFWRSTARILRGGSGFVMS